MGRLKAWGARLAEPFLRRRFKAITRRFLREAGLSEEPGMLKGYKTYVLSGLAVITAIVGWLVGDATLAGALEEAWKILFPLITAALRAGVKNG